RHVERKHRHPAGRVGLLEAIAGGQRLRAIEYRDVVEPEKAALEDIGALGVLTVDPPAVIEQELVKDPLQEIVVAAPALQAFGPEGFQRRKRVDWRIRIAEIPFIGRYLAVRVEITLAQHQVDLVFREVHIDKGQRAAMKGEIPGG